MPDTPDRPSAGPLTLVVRAAFVPEGAQPPPEFTSIFNPLTFRATRDPATGAITCDNAGMTFLGDVRAEFHPDEEQGQELAADDGGESSDNAEETGATTEDSGA